MRKVAFGLLFLLFSLSLCGCNKTNEFIKGQVILNDKYYDTGGFIKSSFDDVYKLLNMHESFVLFTYNNYCNLPFPCENIFEEYMEKNSVRFESIPFQDFKKLSLYDEVKYAPSVIVIDKGNIVDYLDAESDEDLDKYQDVNEFSLWIDKYLKAN